MIMVLGHRGMLGNCVLKYLSQFHEITTTDLRFPDPEFLNTLHQHRGFVVNCIGAIPQKTDKFEVNYELPAFLSTLNCQVIHPGTDCEDDETPYGKSKQLARDWILSGGNTKIIKSSVIGLGTDYGLLSWFLAQDKVDGYADAIWNGITTLEWAKLCRGLIENWDDYDIQTVYCCEGISKFALLLLVAEVFEKKIKINLVRKGTNKSLKGIYTKPIYQQLEELRDFYE